MIGATDASDKYDHHHTAAPKNFAKKVQVLLKFRNTQVKPPLVCYDRACNFLAGNHPAPHFEHLKTD